MYREYCLDRVYIQFHSECVFNALSFTAVHLIHGSLDSHSLCKIFSFQLSIAGNCFEYFQGTAMCSFQTFPDDVPSIQCRMLSIFQMSLKRQFYAFNISYKCGKNMRLEISFSEMFQAPPCIQVNKLYHFDLLELLVHELLHQILKM